MKQKLSTLFNWVHGMLHGGMFSHFLRNDQRAEAANTATYWEIKNNFCNKDTKHTIKQVFCQYIFITQEHGVIEQRR